MKQEMQVYKALQLKMENVKIQVYIMIRQSCIYRWVYHVIVLYSKSV